MQTLYMNLIFCISNMITVVVCGTHKREQHSLIQCGISEPHARFVCLDNIFTYTHMHMPHAWTRTRTNIHKYTEHTASEYLTNKHIKTLTKVDHMLTAASTGFHVFSVADYLIRSQWHYLFVNIVDGTIHAFTRRIPLYAFQNTERVASVFRTRRCSTFILCWARSRPRRMVHPHSCIIQLISHIHIETNAHESRECSCNHRPHSMHAFVILCDCSCECRTWWLNYKTTLITIHWSKSHRELTTHARTSTRRQNLQKPHSHGQQQHLQI